VPDDVTITEIDEDALLALNFSGELSDEEIRALYNIKETYAFVPIKEK
jgi:hypothetical protein